MFEFRLRILDAREDKTGPSSFLGIVEGFPGIVVHAASLADAEFALTRALVEHLEGLRDREATRIELDDFPTVRVMRLFFSAREG
jgi:hypothetical protein